VGGSSPPIATRISIKNNALDEERPAIDAGFIVPRLPGTKKPRPLFQADRGPTVDDPETACARFVPGSCPVRARFVPGSCPVPCTSLAAESSLLVSKRP